MAPRGLKLSKSLKVSPVLSNKLRAARGETRSKLSLSTNGVKRKILDLENNLVAVFSTITSAAKHYGVVCFTISKVLSTEALFDNLTHTSEPKDVRV